MTSRQMAAFDVAKSDPMLGLEAESDAIRDAYGRNGFGQGLLDGSPPGAGGRSVR